MQELPEAAEESDWGCDFSTLMKTPSSSFSHENSPKPSKEEKQKIVRLKASKIRDNSDETSGGLAKKQDQEKDAGEWKHL